MRTEFIEPNNYTTSIQGIIVKTYFENSQYAQIIKTSTGRWYVKKMSTLVYFEAKSYNDALGIRKLIVNRMSYIDSQLK